MKLNPYGYAGKDVTVRLSYMDHHAQLVIREDDSLVSMLRKEIGNGYGTGPYKGKLHDATWRII